MLLIAYALGLLKLSLITFFIIMPYRMFSGGFHLHTHIGCIISTCTFYCGVALLSKTIVLDSIAKYVLVATITVFGIIMIKLYAPADREDVPILSSKIRKQKQILSYVTFIIGLILALFIKDNVICNIIIFGYFVQTCMITRLAYKLTKNKYGYEVYESA